MKRALIVGGAGGPLYDVAGVLQRCGFAAPEQAPDVTRALEQLQATQYDLVILPFDEVAGAQLVSLERGIQRAPSTFFIGTAPTPDPDLILRAMRAGFHEFLASPPGGAELLAAVDRLMRRGQGESRRGTVFAVFSSKGGQGTTTAATNLAHAIAHNHAGARVALADLVIASGDVRVMLNLAPSYDLSSLAEKIDRIDADLLFSLLTPSARGMWVLPAPDNPEFADALDAGTVGAIIEHLRAHHAFTVLDCEHHVSDRTLAALDAADRIILITQMTVPALRAAQRTIGLCQRLGYQDEKLCVVVNRFQSGDVLSTADAQAVLKRDVFWKLPNDYRTAAAALTKGVAIAEYAPASKLAQAYAQLATKLAGGAVEQHNGAGSGVSPSRLRRLFGAGKRG